jgi:1-acyl-sn-glycerol-3-phosphate acyltransferase
MDSETAAKLTLAVYGASAIAAVLWQALRCEVGWQAWLLYCVERVYIGIGYRWRANRRCPFPQDGPAIIIANHRSPIDPLLVWMNSHLTGDRPRIRVIGFMTAREYCEKPGVSWICKHVRCIPVERSGKDMGAVREALRRLERGEWIGIFPEAGINTGEGLRRADPGIAWLALRARVPIYPVFIHNSPQGRTMVEPFYRFQRVRVTYGDAIDLTAGKERGRHHSPEVLQEIADSIMEHLAQLGGVEYQKEAPPPAAPATPADQSA